MNNVLISIIVPVYNVEEYLYRCINSLVNQTYKNIEIIIVDDGSTDNSGKIADKIGGGDCRIKVFHKKNGGLSDARNYGIKKSNGKYLCFVDSDDYVDKIFVEKLYQMIIKYDAKISAVGIKMVFDSEYFLNEDDFNKQDEIFETEEAIKYLYDNSKYGNYACNKLYLRELFNEIEYPVGRKMEDLGTTYLLFDKCKYIVYNSMPLYFYYQRENSILHKPSKQFYIDKFILISQRYEYIKNKYSAIQNNYLSYFYGATEGFPYILEEQRKSVVEEVKIIYPKIKNKLNLKLKIKFILMIYFSRLYIKLFNKY